MSKQGYSGRESFEFYVERYKNKETGALCTEDQLDDPDKYEFVEITLEIIGNAYFTPGKFYGRPEDCYPDESDVEIENIVGPDKSDWNYLLTQSELESAEEKLIELIQNKDYDGCDADDYYDDDSYDDYEPSDPYSEGGRLYPW